MKATQELGEQQVFHHIPESGPLELAELASSFNQMSDRLRQTTVSHDYINAIIEGLREGIVVIDRDMIVRKANSAFLNLVGQSGGEVIGESCSAVFEKCKAKT